MAVNKVVYGNTTVMDISDSTLQSADELALGVTAYNRSGVKLTGTLDSSTQVDLLWTNPSPTSSFSAQTISLSNLSNYLFLLVTVKAKTTTNYYSTTMVQVDESFTNQVVYSFYGPNQRQITNIDLANNSLRISGSGTNCIPYQIRGVK